MNTTRAATRHGRRTTAAHPLSTVSGARRRGVQGIPIAQVFDCLRAARACDPLGARLVAAFAVASPISRQLNDETCPFGGRR